MDRDQSPRGGKNASLTALAAKVPRVSNSPRQEKHYRRQRLAYVSGQVSTADLEIDVEAVLDKMAAKTQNLGQ